MKKVIQTIALLTILILTNDLGAQSVVKPESVSLLSSKVLKMRESKVASIGERKGGRAHSSIMSLFSGKIFAPKLSVDLDSKGIHLFSISEMGLLPAMNVGASFNAGVIIRL